MAAPPAADVRRAAALLRKYGLAQYVSAKTLAAAAKESAKSLEETLKMVASLQMAGQGEGPAPIAGEIARKR